MPFPFIAAGAALLLCNAQVEGSNVISHHRINLTPTRAIIDNLKTGFGPMSVKYQIFLNNKDGFVAKTQLAPNTQGIILIDYMGRFTYIVSVNGAVKTADGMCLRG
jgi:hypothetical protein